MNLGERMKLYEQQTKNILLNRTPVIIRLDGKAFHTFTRGLDKPFDKDFLNIMQQTMLYLCENIQNCVLGYTQSDEITLVLVNYDKINKESWFANEIQKITSVSASMATLKFNELVTKLIDNEKWKNKQFKALFDSRVFNVPKEEVCNNLIWRQKDATRNSINSLAQSLFSHKELKGIKCKDLQNKMLIEKNVNWNNLPVYLKRGSSCIKNNYGKWFIDCNMPILTENRKYIDDLIFIEEDQK